MFKNTPLYYGAISKILHWLSAVLVIGLFALGLWMVDLGYYNKWYTTAPEYHKSIGMLLVIIIIFRLVWRWCNIQPAADKSLSATEKKVSHIVHIVIYILLFAILITGYLIPTANNQGIDVFNWFTVPSAGSFINNQEDIAGELHEWLAFILIALVVLHILAALKHHFINKDNTLRKMLPFITTPKN